MMIPQPHQSATLYPQGSTIPTCASKGACDNRGNGLYYSSNGLQWRGRTLCARNRKERSLQCSPLVQSLTERLAILRTLETRRASHYLSSLNNKRKVQRAQIAGDEFIVPRDMGRLHGIIHRRLRARMRVEKIPTQNGFCSKYLSIIKVVKEQYQVTSSTLSDGLQCFLYNRSSWGFPRSILVRDEMTRNQWSGGRSFTHNPLHGITNDCSKKE